MCSSDLNVVMNKFVRGLTQFELDDIKKFNFIGKRKAADFWRHRGRHRQLQRRLVRNRGDGRLRCALDRIGLPRGRPASTALDGLILDDRAEPAVDIDGCASDVAAMVGR